jgi:hypothetical protein
MFSIAVVRLLIFYILVLIPALVFHSIIVVNIILPIYLLIKDKIDQSLHRQCYYSALSGVEVLLMRLYNRKDAEKKATI